MSTVDKPRRAGMTEDTAHLVKLDADARPLMLPERLALDEILVLDSLFQPRGDSLLLRPGASAKHVEAMAQVVREGARLDPLAVVSFGARWVLVDGHHRRLAYQAAEYTKPVPVAAFQNDKQGKERVAWAVALSMTLNAKDKLSMSADDKLDAAWRLVVLTGYEMSKDELVDASTVKGRTIGNMRAVRKALLAEGHSTESLYDMSWRSARWEYQRLKGNDSEANPDWEQKQLRHLMRKLSPAISDRLPAAMLLEALEGLRPGLEIELETAIQLAKERRRTTELLDI